MTAQIRGFNHAARNANDAVPNYSEHPLESFDANFAAVDTSRRMSLTLSTLDQLSFQVGANANQTISLFDAAIDAVAAERGRLGAVQGRVELTRNQILRQAGTAISVQANAVSINALKLLLR